MRIGIHTDNYRLENRSLDYALDSVAAIGAKHTELNLIQGFDFFPGLGFSPAVSMREDPLEIRQKADARGLSVSMLDAHYPLWSYRCVEHLREAVLFASAMGVDSVGTTDSEDYPDHIRGEEAFFVIRHHLREVLPFAERHKVAVCIEPHGQLSNDPETLLRLIKDHDSEYLRINMDTGNTFIRGWKPQDFLAAVIEKVHHCHVKDVSESLAKAARGEETGIASSEVHVGEGVNAENIIECLKVFQAHGFEGVLSIETHGEARCAPSFRWLCEQVGKVQAEG